MAKIKKAATATAAIDEQIEVPPMGTDTQTVPVQTSEESEEGSGNRYKRLKKWLNKKYEFRRNGLSFMFECRFRGQPDWIPVDEEKFKAILFEAGFVGFESMFSAIYKGSDLVTEFDPLEVYFNSIIPAYDGKTDYIKKLLSYVQLKDESLREYFETQFKKALCRTAAQALGMLRFNKQCVTFHGGQGDGKTSFMRSLMPKYLQDYRFDQFDIEVKEHRIAMATTMFIIVDDLDRIDPKSLGKLKSQFSKDYIQEKLPYGRRTEVLRRRASFWATTNKRDFLIDDENQRWLIFEIKSINHDHGGANGYKSVNIDNVWSQVKYLLDSGYKYELSREEMAKSESVNKQYIKRTVEQELIETHFEPSSKEEYKKRLDPTIRPMQASEMKIYIESQYGNKLNLNEEKIGFALKAFGFEREQYYINSLKSQRWGYFIKIRDQKEISPDDIQDEPTDTETVIVKGTNDLPF